IASRNGGDLRPFLLYGAQGFVDGLTQAIKHLHRQQEQLMWQALVDDAFAGRHTEASHRQRLLAIELIHHDEWVPRGAVRRLSTQLSEAYAGKTPKTITRDINRLRKLDLIRVRSTRVRANVALVRGMRPLVVGNAD
ncbi:MAG: hypothetical protein V7636_161, partial [Actinomycetota bacterium]